MAKKLNNKKTIKQLQQPHTTQQEAQKSFLKTTWNVLGAINLLIGLVLAYCSFSPKILIEYMPIPTGNPLANPIKITNDSIFTIYDVIMQYEHDKIVTINNNRFDKNTELALVSPKIPSGKSAEYIYAGYAVSPSDLIKEGNIAYSVSYKLLFIPFRFEERNKFHAYLDKNGITHWLSN